MYMYILFVAGTEERMRELEDHFCIGLFTPFEEASPETEPEIEPELPKKKQKTG